MQTHGHEVVVVGRPDSRLAASARARGLRTCETRFGGDYDPCAFARARRILAAEKPSIVVVNFNKEAWQFGLAAQALHIPVVARHGFPLLRRALHHKLLMRGVLTRLIVNAESIRERYRMLGFPADGIAVIHNGVPLSPQKAGELRERFGVSGNDSLIVGAGRLESQKRFDRLIEIAARLREGRPNLRVLIAGEGPLRADLQAEIDRRSLHDVVQLVGFIADLPQIIGDADVFLLTSDDEGTPNVLLEAMAARVACVAFAVGAVPEIFTGPLAAGIIEPGNTEAMARWTAMLLDDSDLREAVAREMEMHALLEFSLDASMRRFETLFGQLADAAS